MWVGGEGNRIGSELLLVSGLTQQLLDAPTDRVPLVHLNRPMSVL